MLVIFRSKSRHWSWSSLCACILFAGVVSRVAAQDVTDEATSDPTQPIAGHSLHGEAFNEGPRQRAYAMAGTGEVDFQITTSEPLAQQFFTQGVGQLHGFWYFEAERAFRQAAAHDPQCAMAYWGMAVANRDHQKRAKELIAEAVQRKDSVTPREALWIEAFDRFFNPPSERKRAERWRQLFRDLETIIHEHPQDVEARAFLGWALWQASSQGVPISSHEAVDALLQQVLAVNPKHPGAHHYLIHLWDRHKAARALPAAAGIGPSAPGVAHMWHMAGHIYDKLQRYDDAAWQQEASARVDHAYMQRDRVMPYLIHNYAHNQEWCTRSLMHVGRGREALELAKNLVDVPRHPRFNRLEDSGTCASYGRMRLVDALLRFEMWDELFELAQTHYLAPTDLPHEQARRLYALALAHAARGEVESARAVLEALEPLAVEDDEAKGAAVSKAEAKARDKGEDDEAIAKAKEDAEKAYDRRIKGVQQQLQEARLQVALAEGRTEDALELLESANDLSKLTKSRAYWSAGQRERAVETAREAVESGRGEVPPLAHYVELLAAVDDEERLRESFATLRELASGADLSLPSLARLAPIAARLGLPDDWRLAAPTPEDVGPRPALETLGPIHWRPSAAPDWELVDSQGKSVALEDYRGRPVLVIFYLGFGCLHCVEQLQVFAPLTEQFREAGIDVVGIGTDDVDTLRSSQASFAAGQGGAAFPFPLLADDACEVFRRYRAFDDFEGLPLHGTFLIDADGLVRWQDISYEPFMEAEFLLEESLRLLSMP